MFMRTLRHGLSAMAAAIVVTGVIAAPVSAAAATQADPQCKLAAQVAFSVDPIGRVFGSGTVSCASPVYQITVQVTLTQDSMLVGSARNVCQAQAACSAVVSTLDPAGIQTWCAVATGAYQISPEGPVFDLGTQRVCRQG